MKYLKKAFVFILIFASGIGVYSFYSTNIMHNFETISPGRFYKSGVIPTDELASYLERYNIKTVVDLRIDSVVDSLNPSTQKEINRERDFILAYNDKIDYINIPSKQIPTKENLADFYKVIDNEDNYPILVHCYHGVGRAVLYSSIYRVEKENYTSEEARRKTRFPLVFSNFDHGTEKGEWLKNYSSRQHSDENNAITKVDL